MAILLVFAFVLFVVGGWIQPPVDLWRRLLCWGLACWVASQIWPAAAVLFK